MSDKNVTSAVIGSDPPVQWEGGGHVHVFTNSILYTMFGKTNLNTLFYLYSHFTIKSAFQM